MDKTIVERVNGSDIQITIHDDDIHINDSWNGFEGRFRREDIDNFITWLEHAFNSHNRFDKCLDLCKRFFIYQRQVYGNYVASDRIPYIKDILNNIHTNKLYETVLGIKDNIKLLKDVLNHASLWELDGVYNIIKTKKGELQ